jgi:hypothetical protein
MTRWTRAWLEGARCRLIPPRISLGTVVSAGFLAVVLTGCGSADIPVVTFDPASACTTDGRQPGAYPALEGLLPKSYDGKAPTRVDSGRNCTTEALGTLADDGITGVEFAGATWELSGTTGLTAAVFQGKGLDTKELFNFYRDSGGTDRHTEKMSTSNLAVGGKAGRRLDILASDGTGQTVVVWPSDQADTVFVLLAADIGDAAVLDALGQFAGT